MIYKWNELDYYHFNEFLQKFEDGEEWTKDKVLEIQDPYGLIFGKLRRTFFGWGIRIENYEEHNTTLLGLLKAFQSGIPDLMDESEKLSMCILSQDGGPKIMPLLKGGLGQSSLTYIRHSLFGDLDKDVEEISKSLFTSDNPSPVLWYEKGKDGNRELWVPAKEKVPNATKRFIRFRTMDLDDWKRLMDKWIEDKDSEELTKGDLKAEDFTIMPEDSRIVFEKIQEFGGFDKVFGTD